MNKKILISIVIFAFSLLLSSCSYKEFEDKLKSDMNNKEQNIDVPNMEPGIVQDNNINPNDETEPHNEVPPIEDSSIYKVGEKVTYTFEENIQEYTITKVTEDDNISDLDQNHFIDKTLIEDGKLKEGYKFIMLDVMVKNISQFSDESGEDESGKLYVSALSLAKRDDAEEDKIFFPEVTYFKNPAKDSEDLKDAYKYRLPIGQSAKFQMGWVVAEEYFNSDLFICIGGESNFELRKYVEFR